MNPASRAAVGALFAVLGAAPAGPAAEVMALAMVVKGMLDPARRRAALRWAAAVAPTPRSRFALASSLLAHRGRCMAFGARLGMPDEAAFRRRVTVEGRAHLEAARARGGTLLVGLHVGPGRTSAGLRAHGYPVTSSGESGHAVWEGPREALRDRGSILWSGRAQERALGLFRLRQRLLAGEIVAITADAPSGQPAMWAAVPGGRLPLRSGWLVLRRQTGATTLPVLSHLEGGRQVITIHPPLPPLDPDPEADGERCRAAMTGILADYARRHPAQAFALAFELEADDATSGASEPVARRAT